MKAIWILATVLAVVSTALGIEVVKKAQLEQQFNEQAPAAERWIRQCASVRAGLVMSRRNLWKPSEDRKDWGLTTYKTFTRNDWADVNACAIDENVYLGAACLDDETSCMIHALDWALVNVR
jgi:hypothetical protein